MEIVTSWMQQGIERGIEQGIEQGISQGRFQEARGLLLRLGTRRFGEASATVQARLDEAELTQLEAWAERLLEVESWQELVQENSPL